MSRPTGRTKEPSAVVLLLLLVAVADGAFLSTSVLKRRHQQPSHSRTSATLPYQLDVPSELVEEVFETNNTDTTTTLTATNDNSDNLVVVQPPDLHAMRARAGVLRRSILEQQMELQQLERHIMCCSNAKDYSHDGWFSLLANRTLTTFQSSSSVLWRKLQRVHGSVGVQNHKWNGSVGNFMVAQTHSGVRIVDRVLKNQTQLLQLVADPETPSLIAHVPAIVARLDRLESHVAPILERVLNNQRHLASIEPYLDEILERFDDIEPHLPWILEHIDILAPYTGLLLKHIDELLPYAHLEEYETLPAEAGWCYQYALAEQLLPYLEFYVSRLDTVGPHLPLLRPHVPKLLKHNRIAKMSPHIDRLFALGYKDNLGASANIDILLFWFGWALRVPGLPRLFFAIPGSPRIVTFLANRLPKRFVRGYCSGISCTVDGDYGNQWNKLSK